MRLVFSPFVSQQGVAWHLPWLVQTLCYLGMAQCETFCPTPYFCVVGMQDGVQNVPLPQGRGAYRTVISSL